jgi:2-polyprenyl-3-methyl-5-hydroxy-6-metoxy-1,4-benzoquinol methylase
MLQQVWQISEALDSNNIKLYGGTLQKNNLLLHDGIIKLVDFEYALPEDSGIEMEEDFINHIRRHWDSSVFENRLKILLINGTLMTKKNRTKYPEELRKADNMVKNDWDNYQKSNVGNSAKWRIENLDLRQFAGKDKTLLDLGANHGEFAVELADDFQHITALEPYVQAPELAENVTWVAKGFKDYVNENTDTFDVIFSFAMTIQVRDNDKLNENQIANGHYHMTKDGGIMIYETQKLEARPLNQSHVDKMLSAFRDKYGQEIKSGNARQSGKRLYYIFKK